jgi:outer membrane immunogenic protein
VIRKLLLSTVAIAAVSTSAFAADLPSRRAPPVYIPPPVPQFSWTGFYVGGDIGDAFGRDSVTQVGAPGGNAVYYNTGVTNGIIGGGHVGYNFSTQSLPILGGIAGGMSGLPFIGGAGGVVGVEGDIRGTDYRSSTTFGGPTPLTESFRNEINGSIRGRLGIAVDRALFFATGGVAFAQFQNAYSSPVISNGYGQLSSTRVGYAVGGGVEYAITTNFSLRAEYRYEDFGRYTDVPTFVTPIGFTATHHDVIETATVGFSYKFESPMAPAPVVARY